MSIDTLLDFIAQPESRGDFNAVWGGIKAKHRPSKPITSMTVGDVLDWQDSIDPLYMSEAAGAWQFMKDTLRGLYREAGVPLSALFNEATQRKLATALLRRRGLDDYLAGKMTAKAFGQGLSKEWASLPAMTVDRAGRYAAGQSYYAGDGLNKAHVTRASVLQAISEVKAEPLPQPRKNPAQSKTIQATVGAAVAGTGSVFAALGKLPPQTQYIVIGLAALALIGLTVIAWERLRKWGRGDR